MRWSLLLTLLIAAPVYGEDGPLTREVRQQLAGRYATYEVKSYLPPAGYAVKSFLPLSTPARVVPAPPPFRTPVLNYGFHPGHACPRCGSVSPRGTGTWIKFGPGETPGSHRHHHRCPDGVDAWWEHVRLPDRVRLTAEVARRSA